MVYALSEKNCEDCGLSFSPHSGAQKWCDDCREAKRTEKETKSPRASSSFNKKVCEKCETEFQPRSGRQKWCDTCRETGTVSKSKRCECGTEFVPSGRQLKCDACRYRDMQPVKKNCQRCGDTFTPISGHQKFCDPCREIREQEQQTWVPIEIECRWCGKNFTPTSNAQKQCDDCRSDGSRCSCGSWISGREKWGPTWGGGCDRAEERVNLLMAAMSTRLSR